MKVGVFVGRLCPVHIGHQRIIDRMIDDCGVENSVVFVGSSVSPITWRNLFPYFSRRNWVKQLYPNLRVVGMPDTFNGDKFIWNSMLDDYIEAIFPEASSIIYYGGSKKDTDFYTIGGKYKKEIVVLDRSITNISATKIRCMLRDKESIKGLVDKKVIDEVTYVFGHSYSVIKEKMYNT